MGDERHFPDMSDGLKIKNHSITEDYIIHWKEKLGTGISGPVRPCVKKDSKERFALKCLLDSPKARTEAKLHLKCNNHPNIVKVYDVYSNDVHFPGEPHPKTRLLIVMEFMEGGELFDRISRESGFTEKKAAKYLRQISQAVFRCHSLNIAHRDLKPENLLLKNNAEPEKSHPSVKDLQSMTWPAESWMPQIFDTKDAEVKLTDFGFAKVDDGNLQTPHFTPYYVAPQVLEAHRYVSKKKRGIIQTSQPYTYDKSCDMWSVGVILYIMLCGYPPFYSETPSRQITSEMRRKILSGQYEFPESDWQFISESAKDVVRSLLHVDPSQRMNIQGLLGHSWLNDAPDTQLQSPAVFLNKEGMEDIKLAHSRHLTEMRLPESTLTLKPLSDTENPIIRKRKHRQKSLDEVSEPKQKVSLDCRLKPLRDIIAYCILPPKVDDDESVLNNLVTTATDKTGCHNGLNDVLRNWNWDGSKFQSKVEKVKLAHQISQLVKDMTSETHIHNQDS